MTAPSPPPQLSLVISVVSHGHAPLVQRLLRQLAQLSMHSVTRVVLTQNVPEAAPQPPDGGWPFTLELVANTTPLGFGANHNRALASGQEEFVCVLNPDVQLCGEDPFGPLVAACAAAPMACAYPIQIGEDGRPQACEREIPSPLALVRRRLMGRVETRVDWVNAACLVLSRQAWHALGGFDERYFMYCEDVDFCLRLRLIGGRLVKTPARVVHVGQRASGRSLQHLRWHVGSLLRLWRSPVYRRAQQLLTSPSAGAGTIGTP